MKKIINFVIKASVFSGIVWIVGSAGSYELGAEFGVFAKNLLLGVAVVLTGLVTYERLNLE